MLITILIIGLIVAVIIVIAFTKPNTFHVQRSIIIDSSPENIFLHINKLRDWQFWSPYEFKDPKMQREFGRIDTGKGAFYAWQGNNQVGQGYMEIIESKIPSNIKIALTFIKPFKGNNTAEFTLTPENNTTQLTWAMYGPNTFISKIMQIFINFDRMIGNDFSSGLNKLKKLVEDKT